MRMKLKKKSITLKTSGEKIQPSFFQSLFAFARTSESESLKKIRHYFYRTGWNKKRKKKRRMAAESESSIFKLPARRRAFIFFKCVFSDTRLKRHNWPVLSTYFFK